MRANTVAGVSRARPTYRARNGCFDMYICVARSEEEKRIHQLGGLPSGNYRFASFPPGQTRSLKGLRNFLNRRPLSVRRGQYDIVKS